MAYRVKTASEKELGQETTIDGKSYPAPIFKSYSMERSSKPPKLAKFSKSKSSQLEETDGPSEPSVKSKVILQSKGEGWSLKLPKHSKYRVVFIQDTSEDKVSYELFAGNEYSTTKDAFNLINTVLSPLMDDGNLFLPKPLLKHIILPEPLLPSKVGARLVEIMEKEPGVHSDWQNIVEKLRDAELKKESKDKFEDESGLSSLKRKIQNVKQPSKAELSLASSSSSRLSVDLANIAPLIAVPTAASKLTDDETSDEVWTLFRKGTLRARNEDKSKIWLIEATEKQYVKSALKLILSSVVNINERHPRTGDTALHIAIRSGNIVMVKLLLAYQADLTITNAKKETPYDVAKKLDCANASVIKELVETIKKLRVESNSYFAKNSKVPKKRGSSDIFLLSLDGGGMRSVIMCHTLKAIEQRMNALSDSCKPLQSYFDYIAGTSAGSIIGGLLLYSDISVSFSGMYLYKFMVDVFCCPKSDRIKKLKGFLTDIVGEDTTMSQPKNPASNLIVTSTIANISPNKLHLMTTYGEPRDEQLGPKDRKVWEALVASAAAPTFFPAFQSFLDGGLMANNPTLPAMTDILQQVEKKQKKVKIGCVLSLGTGYTYPPQTVENFEVYVPGFTKDVAKKLFQSSMGLVSLLSHFAEQTTQSNGEVVRQAETWSKSIGANYLRLSPPLSEDIAPDIKSTDKFISLIYETELYILKQHQSIDDIAKMIMSK